MKTYGFFGCAIAVALWASCSRDNIETVRAQVDQLEQDLLPVPGTPREEIEQLWGRPLETRGESFSPGTGDAVHLQACSYLLIQGYWLYVSYDQEMRCFHAFFGFDDPRVPAVRLGMNPYDSLEHSRSRLQFLRQIKTRRDQ